MSAGSASLRASRLAPLLAALAMLGPLSIDTFFPAFRQMEVDLGISAAAMQQTLSVYLGAYAVMALFHGPLSDAYGRRPVILISTALFALASVGCTFAPSFASLLLFRAAQGIAAGAGLIVGRAIIRDRFHGADAQKLMAQISLIFGVAPAMAPIFGGWLLPLGGWRSIFGAVAVFALALWLWCLKVLPETLELSARQRFSARDLTRTYQEMLRDPVLVALSVATAANFGGLFVYIAAAPVFVMDYLKLSEQQFAWLFVPAIGGMMLGATLSHRMAGRLHPPQTMAVAYGLMAAGGLSNLLISLWLPGQLPWAVLPIALASVGMAVAFPTMTLLLLDRYPNRRGAASSLQSFFVLVANAVLSGLIVSLIAHRPMWLAIYAAASMSIGFAAWRVALRHLQAPIAPLLQPSV